MALRLVLSLGGAFGSAFPVNQEKRTALIYWTPAPRWNTIKKEMQQVANRGLIINHPQPLGQHYGISSYIAKELIKEKFLAYVGDLGGVLQWRLTDRALFQTSDLFMVGSTIFEHTSGRQIIPSIETEAIQLEDKANDPGDSLFDPRD